MVDASTMGACWYPTTIRDERHHHTDHTPTVLSAMGSQHATILDKVGQGDQGITDTVHNATATIKTDICQVGNRASDAAQQVQNRVSDAAQHLHNHFVAAADHIVDRVTDGDQQIQMKLCDIESGVRQVGAEVSRDTQAGLRDIAQFARGYHHENGDRFRSLVDQLSTGFRLGADQLCNAQDKIKDSVGATREEVLRSRSDILLEGCKNTDLLVRTLDKETSEIGKALVAGFRDTTHNIFVAQSTITAQMAECCCEIKELIRSTASDTIARELSDSKAEVLFLKSRLPGVAIGV